MESEDQLQFFLKVIFVQEWSSGTHFDHGQFEIKTFPIEVINTVTTGSRYCTSKHVQLEK